MRRLEIKEQLVSEKERITLDDNIVGITIKNQGTTLVTSSFNSENKANEILPLTAEPYGGIDGFYISGYLMIDFSGVGTNSAIVKYFIDKGPIENC